MSMSGSPLLLHWFRVPELARHLVTVTAVSILFCGLFKGLFVAEELTT